jgi:hypothetical protein
MSDDKVAAGFLTEPVNPDYYDIYTFPPKKLTKAQRRAHMIEQAYYYARIMPQLSIVIIGDCFDVRVYDGNR